MSDWQSTDNLVREREAVLQADKALCDLEQALTKKISSYDRSTLDKFHGVIKVMRNNLVRDPGKHTYLVNPLIESCNESATYMKAVGLD